jgi:hypothetical protein
MESSMNKPEMQVGQDKAQQRSIPMPDMSSSQGDDSVSITPKDVSPGDATAKDVIARNTHSDDLEERQEALLDDAIELTFPASDPISISAYSGRAAPKEKQKTKPAQEEGRMTIVVPNTRPDQPRVTLFGQLDDGAYVAKVMDEDEVPYMQYWKNALDQAMVYIEPDDDQLARIVSALNEGKLEFSRLQDFGAADGETSAIPLN